MLNAKALNYITPRTVVELVFDNKVKNVNFTDKNKYCDKHHQEIISKHSV